MYASHVSLRDDFEVSCSELDCLVNLAEQIGIDGGVFGSRMTGGGFGGCTVSLVASDKLESIATQIQAEYQSQTGVQPNWFATTAARGAFEVVF